MKISIWQKFLNEKEGKYGNINHNWTKTFAGSLLDKELAKMELWMVKAVKCLPHKPEGLVRILRKHLKNTGMVACIYNKVLWDSKTGEPLKLTGQYEP